MLVEVVTALALVAMGLTALAAGIPGAAMAVSEGTHLSTATFLAAARLEQVRSADWREASNVDRIGLSVGPLSAPEVNGAVTFPDETILAQPYAAYSRQVRIVDCGLPPGCGAVISPHIRQVTVGVAYRPVTASGLAAGMKTVSLTSLVIRR